MTTLTYQASPPASIAILTIAPERIAFLERSPESMSTHRDAEIGRMNHSDRLVALFRAFRDRNDHAFQRAAEAIISEETLANHHEKARELKKALATVRSSERSLSGTTATLSVLPKDRRFGESLVSVVEPKAESHRVFLAPQAKCQIDRAILEHTQRLKLAKFGFSPKTKLLFWGPPGCGKTLTAHKVASELGLPLGVVRLNALITSFLGETASNIQRIFDLAQSTPMVLLIDEADAIAKDREDRNDVGELKRVVNSLLQAIDAFRSTESVIIATSNHQHMLDDALWRRFDDLIVFPLPSTSQIKSFLGVILNGISLNGSLDVLSRSARSLSYSQIERVIIELLKTMILDDRNQIDASEVAESFKEYKRLLRKAQARPRRTNRRH